MENLFAPLRGVRAQLEYRRPVRSLKAKLAHAGARRLQVGEGQLEAQSGIFAAKKHLGSFQQRLAPRLLLPKLHNANYFIPHKIPRKLSRKIPRRIPAKYLANLPKNLRQITRRAKCKFSLTSPLQPLPTI